MTTELERAFARLAPREVHGIAAVLLPYLGSSGPVSSGPGSSGPVSSAGPEGVDWEGFEAHLVRTREAGLDCAVNMDTGFGDLLTPKERTAVLDATLRALGPGVRFYAGAFAEEAATRSDPRTAWAHSVAEIEAHGATPVIVQCRAMHEMAPKELAETYAAAASASSTGALAFELSPRFAPHGAIWSDEAFARILEVPGLLGAKHSSLDRNLELARLAARDRTRPGFRVYTGNDLAIDMVAYGSDYLLGLATFAPDRFAERDRLLAAGDAGFPMLNDALQHLGNVGFRAPIPAYKHAAAQFLHLCGRLEGDAIHPRAPRRPGSERVMLLDCALRLGLVDDAEKQKVWDERVAPFLEEPAAG